MILGSSGRGIFKVDRFNWRENAGGIRMRSLREVELLWFEKALSIQSLSSGLISSSGVLHASYPRAKVYTLRRHEDQINRQPLAAASLREV